MGCMCSAKRLPDELTPEERLVVTCENELGLTPIPCAKIAHSAKELKKNININIIAKWLSSFGVNQTKINPPNGQFFVFFQRICESKKDQATLLQVFGVLLGNGTNEEKGSLFFDIFSTHGQVTGAELKSMLEGIAEVAINLVFVAQHKAKDDINDYFKKLELGKDDYITSNMSELLGVNCKDIFCHKVSLMRGLLTSTSIRAAILKCSKATKGIPELPHPQEVVPDPEKEKHAPDKNSSLEESIRITEEEAAQIAEEVMQITEEEETADAAEENEGMQVSEEEEVVPIAEEEVVKMEEEKAAEITEEEVVPITEEEVVPITKEEVVPITEEEIVPITEEEAAQSAEENEAMQVTEEDVVEQVSEEIPEPVEGLSINITDYAEDSVAMTDKNEEVSMATSAVIEEDSKDFLLACPNGHILSWTNILPNKYFNERNNWMITCDNCSLPYSRACWYCEECDFNMCDTCGIEMGISPPKLKCRQEHILLYMCDTPQFYGDEKYFCQRCGEEQSSATWHCRECRFDICVLCASVAGYEAPSTEVLCPRGHELVYEENIVKIYQERGGGHPVCDHCRKRIDSGCMHCEECSYDLCSTSYSYLSGPIADHPGFRCPSSHLMHWFDVSKHYNKNFFICNACGERKEGFCFHCYACQIDMCGKCSSNLSKYLNLPINVECSNGHSLPWSTKPFAQYLSKAYKCKRCANIYKNIGSFHCQPCKYDICLSCF